MKLTDENGQEYEFKKGYEYDDVTYVAGLLKPIEKEWPQDGDKYYYVPDPLVLDGVWQPQFEKDDMSGIYKTELEAEQARDRIRSLQEADVWSAFKPTEEDFCKIEMQVPTKYLKAWKALEDKK